MVTAGSRESYAIGEGTNFNLYAPGAFWLGDPIELSYKESSSAGFTIYSAVLNPTFIPIVLELCSRTIKLSASVFKKNPFWYIIP